MGSLKVIVAGFLALVSAASAGGGLRPSPSEATPERGRLPESLSAFYPPAADRPVYLLKMLSLETSFSGVIADLMEGDVDGARGSFDDFQRRYRELAGMIPEWQGEYPEQKVKELGNALAVGDRGSALTAFEAVGGICHNCHIAAMVPVQQKYHWGDFGAVEVWDPLSGKAIGYRQFKQYLSTNLAGIAVDLGQRQSDRAREQFKAFRSRFESLSSSCQACHQTESRHFVDREMRDTIEELGSAFEDGPIATESVIELLQKIGRESCSKCHLVYLPAAYARHTAR